MAIHDLAIADKPTLDAVSTKVGSFLTSMLSAVLAERATEESLTWAFKQSGIGKAMDSLAGLGNSTLQGCDTFSAVLANSTARGLLINTPILLETVLLTEYGANMIVNSSAAMNTIAASAALRATCNKYEYFNKKAVESTTAMAVIYASSVWVNEIINNEKAFKLFIENSGFASTVTGSSAYFAVIAASTSLMNILCLSSIGRTAMYNNRTVTESIIQASAAAIGVIGGMTSITYPPVTGTNVVVFNYPVWILSKLAAASYCTANTTTFADSTTDTTNSSSVTTLNRFATNQICTVTTVSGFWCRILKI